MRPWLGVGGQGLAPQSLRSHFKREALLISRVSSVGFLHDSILLTRGFSSLACPGQLRIPLPALPGQGLTLGLSPVSSGLLRSYCPCPQKLDTKQAGALPFWNAATVGPGVSRFPLSPREPGGRAGLWIWAFCGTRRFLAVGLQVCV